MNDSSVTANYQLSAIKIFAACLTLLFSFGCNNNAATHGTPTGASMYSITGTISPGSAATVALSGAARETVTADSSGAYSFTGLAAGTYTVTPSLAGVTFVPPSILVTVNNASATANFSAGSSSLSVSVSPQYPSVQVGFPLQFTATVQNDPFNKGVTWSAQDGTIDATGKFTAPATQESVQIVATSVEDPTKKGTTEVFVTPAPTGISVSPTKATVQANGAQQFTATGGPFGTIPVVNWSVSGTGCTGGGCGTIDSTGRYTAPPSVPTPPEVMITATSATDSTISGSATAILGGNSANGKLKGQYAFLIQGYDGDGIEAMAGTFVADGNGNLTAGVEDLDFTSSLYVAPNVPFTGTYAIGSDNRGSMTLSALSQTFSFSLGSFTAGIADRGRLVEVDGTDFYGTGVLIKQDPSAFTTAAISGGYAFGFSGARFGGSKLIAAGRFTANGGSVSDGQVDIYNSQSFISGAGAPRVGVNEPLTGSYQVGANGRGTVTFTGPSPEFTNFSFYVVSPTELLFIETDSCQSVFQPCSVKGGLSGIVLQQAGGPFSTSSLYGGAVLNLTGSTDVSAGQVAYDRSVSVGHATFDGGGGLVGTIDTNNDGVFSPNNNVVGVYTVDTNGMGRGVMNLLGGQQTMPFYIVSSGNAFIIDTSGTAEFGMFEPQTGGPFNNASISGSYVLGTLPLLSNWGVRPSRRCGDRGWQWWLERDYG